MQLAHAAAQQLPPSPSVKRYQIPHHACAEFPHKTAHPPEFRPSSSLQDRLPERKAAPYRSCQVWAYRACTQPEMESTCHPLCETPPRPPCRLIQAGATASAHHTQCVYFLLIPDLPY